MQQHRWTSFWKVTHEEAELDLRTLQLKAIDWLWCIASIDLQDMQMLFRVFWLEAPHPLQSLRQVQATSEVRCVRMLQSADPAYMAREVGQNFMKLVKLTHMQLSFCMAWPQEITQDRDQTH